MPDLPQSQYLRRRVVRAYLGIDEGEFTKLVRAGVLKPYYLRGAGRAWFRREDLARAEAEGKIFKPAKTKTP